LIRQERDLRTRDDAAPFRRHGQLRLVGADEQIDRRPLSDLPCEGARPASVDLDRTTARRLVALDEIADHVGEAGRHGNRQREDGSIHVYNLIRFKPIPQTGSGELCRIY
jgi:hypothetical protein